MFLWFWMLSLPTPKVLNDVMGWLDLFEPTDVFLSKEKFRLGSWWRLVWSMLILCWIWPLPCLWARIDENLRGLIFWTSTLICVWWLLLFPLYVGFILYLYIAFLSIMSASCSWRSSLAFDLLYSFWARSKFSFTCSPCVDSIRLSYYFYIDATVMFLA